ncbi:hypothetical protein LTR37_016049 [Vermiconidia calcicola]|uniref:Uncharacterized protein n=1 Tax=Vermiconidia calcicola TaxID=1690605 RepID=A0ACC3MQJ9_9PEZI|nr:hypothetical protein LTR37_016049 [Vermiconidia calcicola]
MSSLRLPIQTASIAISLMSAGGIACLSLFDIPELQSQPASRSLPSIRWLFSRGSHIFPTASLVSTAGFAYLAINTLPQGRAVTQLLSLGSNSTKINAYLAAAVLNFAIGPFTSTMVPTNFRLIELNEQKGGARSEKSAKEGKFGAGERSAEESTGGKGDVNQFTDLSNPQTHARNESSAEEDKEVRELLGKFGRLNAVRAVLMGAGGVAGVIAAQL